MGDLINGRTPEEIKRGLRWIAHDCDDNGEDCNECECVEECHKLVEDDVARDSLALIERLEAQRPKWISVKERLPESAGKYIVCTKKRSVYCTAFRFFHGKGYFATDSNTHITHWMPLPEPPEE